MNRRRKLIVALCAGALVTPVGAFAQQPPGKISRIGFLIPETLSATSSRIEAMRNGLRELGYVEGKNIAIEYQVAEGNYRRLRELAMELVRLNVDVLVAFGQKAVVAAKGVTTTIPIVVPASGDPVRSGIVTSLSRPDGNVTGGSLLSVELGVKRLELIKETATRITRAGLLTNPADPFPEGSWDGLEAAARALKVSVQRFEVRAPTDFDGVFAAMLNRGVDGIIVGLDTIFWVNQNSMVSLVTRNHLPSVGGYNEFAEAGGLLSYGPNVLGMYHRAAFFVDKILKGAKPADLPMEQPTKFDLVVNMKTAKTLGIKIPNSVLLRADKVIE